MHSLMDHQRNINNLAFNNMWYLYRIKVKFKGARLLVYILRYCTLWVRKGL